MITPFIADTVPSLPPAFMIPNTPMLILWTSLPLSVEGAKGLAAARGGGAAIAATAPVAGWAMAWVARGPEDSTGGSWDRLEEWKVRAAEAEAPGREGESPREWRCGT